MKYQTQCVGCGKPVEYLALHSDKDREVTCPHCGEYMVRYPAWDTRIA